MYSKQLDLNSRLNGESLPANLPLRRRRWLFRLFAVLLGIAPVLLIEVGLRLFGMGRDLSLVVPYLGSTGWYTLNSRFDEPFYGDVDLTGPEVRPFQLPKPRGTRRILVVGGSTVVGFPYPSELAFPRHLQVALSAQSDGQETIEVLNAGITAMNTSTEVAVVEEGLKTQPDVIVVYTGHNEFYGPGGAASSAGWLSPSWYRVVSSWRRLYLAQAIRRLTKRSTSPNTLIESLPSDVHLSLEGETYRKGLTRYRENLSAMAELAGQAGVPIVFVSPVSNEHDQPPIEDLRPKDPQSPHDEWRTNFKAGERELFWGDLKKAIEQLESASSLQEHDPVICFRRGQAYEKAERPSEAIKQFELALDYDGCRFRAPSLFRSAMAEIADKYSRQGAVFVDLHSEITRESELACPGRKHFLEHVHFTWAGNRCAGRVIARSIWQTVWSHEWSDERDVSETRARELLGVQDEDHLAARSLASVIYQKPPFREGVDAAKLAKGLIDESLTIFRRLSPERQILFEERTQQDMSGDLLGALIRGARSVQKDSLLGSWLKARSVRQPWRRNAIDELKTWLYEHGEIDEAKRLERDASKWPQ